MHSLKNINLYWGKKISRLLISLIIFSHEKETNYSLKKMATVGLVDVYFIYVCGHQFLKLLTSLSQ